MKPVRLLMKPVRLLKRIVALLSMGIIGIGAVNTGGDANQALADEPRLKLSVPGGFVLGVPPLQMQLTGDPNQTYVIQTSTDLANWTTLSTNQTDATGAARSEDAQWSQFNSRFYRAVPVGVPNFRGDRILVKPLPGVDLTALHGITGAQVLRHYPAIGNLQVVHVPPGLTVPAVLALYQQSGLVAYAEADGIVHALATPNDFRYQDGSLWGLNNVGQLGGVPDADIDAPEGWDTQNSAANVIVAVIDTGVRYTHEDLAANMWVNPADGSHGINAITDTNDPNDDHGHGSHVAGTIGGVGNNSVGVVGVCWKVQIMALKFLDPQGNGSISDAIQCIDFARNNGAKVINASWGSTTFTSQALHDAIASAGQAGIIFVAAAGNSSANNDTTPLYPASYDLDNIIAVAATTRTDELATFSDYGAASVDLGAPGAAIFSCWNGSDSDYKYLDGSSAATPHVAGACALLMARFPGEDYHQTINRILSTVDPLPTLAGKTVSGGRLNLQKALGGTPPPSPTVTVTATDANASEAGPDTGTFTVTRTGGTTTPLVVNYTLGGTAGNGTDYQSLPTSVTIPAGASSANITVTPIDDTAVEGNESVVITLAADATYTVGSPGSATITIADNDQTTLPVVTVTAIDPNASETGPDPGVIRFHRTGDTSQPLTVNWSFSGTAVNGTDYQQLPTTGNFPAGQADADLTITPIDDSLVEGNETVVLTLSANAAYTVGSPSSATVTIADNDSPPPLPTVTVTATDANASESGDTGTFTVSRTGSTATALTVNYSLGGTAGNGSDYQTLSGSVTIAAGASSANITVTPVDDTIVEGNETVVLAISANAAYTIGSPGSATVTIADNDSPPPPPTVTVTVTDANASESGDTGTFTVSRSGSTASSLTVFYSMSGSAQNGSDYQTLSGSVAIPAGASSANITVTPIDDTIVEGNETVVLTLSANAAYTVGSPSSATVTIADNDSPPPLPTVTVVASDANASETGDTGTFTVSRSGSTASSLTVFYSMSGSAQNGSDYQTLSGSVAIPAGASSANITLVPINDTIVEGNETAVLTLSPNAAYSVGSPNNSTVTIADNDQPPPLQANFTASPLLGIVPLIVQFADTSTGNPVSWDWNFGDGSPHDTAQNTSHIYLLPGDYTATLTVRNSAGATSSKSVTIHATLLGLGLEPPPATPAEAFPTTLP